MSAQRPDNPLLRPSNPFERRIATAASMAKPAITHGSLIGRTLPGGTALETARRSGRASKILTPWTVTSAGIVIPATVSGKMPKIGGVAINTTPRPALEIPPDGDFVVYWKLTWNTTLSAGFLVGATLLTVDIAVDAELPDDTLTIKHYAFCSGSGGVPDTSYFNTAVNAQLCDAGANATMLIIS